MVQAVVNAPQKGADEVKDSVDIVLPSKRGKKCMVRSTCVEPVLFLIVISSSIFGIVQINVVELQYCKSIYGIYDQNTCLNTTSSLFRNVQKYTSSNWMYQTISMSVFSAIPLIFLGPWSDTFGRRPLMLIGSLGYILTVSLWTWASVTNPHPNYFLLFDLPLSLTGGTAVVHMAVFCYLCDITTSDQRAFRLGAALGFLYFGSLFGTLAAPYLKAISYTFTLAACAIGALIPFLYVLFFLEESVPFTKNPDKSISRNPFLWSHITSIYETCYTKQSKRLVRLLVYVGILTTISHVQCYGEGAVYYLFVQKTLGWKLAQFTGLISLCVITSAFSAWIATSKILHLADLEIINIVNGIRLLSALMFYFGSHKWLVYVTAALSSTAGIYGTVLKSFLSKIMHSDDIGKVFALCSTLEALSPLVGSPIYNMVYEETIDTDPKTIFLVSAFLCFLLTILTAKIVHCHLSGSLNVSIEEKLPPKAAKTIA